MDLDKLAREVLSPLLWVLGVSYLRPLDEARHDTRNSQHFSGLVKKQRLGYWYPMFPRETCSMKRHRRNARSQFGLINQELDDQADPDSR